jgi:hypothetical protein
MNMPDDVLCDPDKPEYLWVQLDPALPRSTTGVIDGARTHNHWSHNPVLCQLSYDHQDDGPARPVGFEPTTLDLEGPCSILMSYGRLPPGV